MTMTPEEKKRIQELGGPVEEFSLEYAGLDFKVPSYPSIVKTYIDERHREGYLIQEVPGGYRYISIDLPEFELDDAGKEHQLPAPDEFGSVEETLQGALRGARNHLHALIGERADDYRSWSKELAADALATTAYEDIVAEYIGDGESIGYLIQKLEDGYRYIFIELGEDDIFGPRVESELAAIRSARADWNDQSGTVGDGYAGWTMELASDAQAPAGIEASELAAKITELTSGRLDPQDVALLSLGLADFLNSK